MSTDRDERRAEINAGALGIGGLAVFAIVLLAIVQLRPDDGANGTASPTASPAMSSSAAPADSAAPPGAVGDTGVDVRGARAGVGR